MGAVFSAQVQESGRVPFVGTPLASWYDSSQDALEAVPSFFTEKDKKGLCASFPYQTTQGQNIPLKPTRIQIWANNPPTLNNWLILLPFQRISLFCFSPLYSSGTPKRFLHACTPERRTRAFAHLFQQREHGQAQPQQNISFKKNFRVLKRWEMIQAVAQVNPTA